MSRIVDAVRRHAALTPLRPALRDEDGLLTYRSLATEIAHLAERLRALRPRALALLADNGMTWALADLGALAADIPIVPLPPFFSASQLAHALRTAGVDLVLTDQPARIQQALQRPDLVATPFYGNLFRLRLPSDAGPRCALPAGTRKVTFTSGTTGEPKGVCLGYAEMEAVAESLCQASAADAGDRHLSLLPLATLLENIGGLYTPLLAGATACLPPLAAVGLRGSSTLDVGRMNEALHAWQATTAILVPQMLQALVAAGRMGVTLPDSLRYLAVGGAPVSAHLVDQAHALGLPVYQGYGLSECASVVAASGPDAQRAGSVGRPLPHVRLAFAADGEILVHGPRWRGYLGGEAADTTVVATGDLGYLDEAGYLFLTGRKKNLFITAFGRNVAPEWVEGELVAHPGIAQAVLFGEARPFNCAVIVPSAGATHDAIDAAIDAANQRLPDYARVHAWLPADAPFTPAAGLSTPNGRLRRDAIRRHYADRIDALYQPQMEH